MAKAYMTSLPNTTDTQKGLVKIVDSPKVPAMDYRSGFKNVGTAIDNTNQFLETFSKMKYEGFQADLDRLELEHLHQMQDAKDPCELEALNEEWKKQYDSALKDDIWSRSYYKSKFYKQWQDRNQQAQQKIYYAKQHEFAEICATETLNKMAETASLLDNPNDVEQYIQNGEAMLRNIKHLSADSQHKLMANFYKDTVSRLYNSDPNKAVAFLDSVGNRYDAYGVSSEEIRKKADTYNKARERERQEDIARAQRIKENANKALATQIKARILQNPEQADAIIDSISDNDSVFVNVSDWYRKGIGKNTNPTRSPLSQTVTAALISGKTPQEVFEKYPELINDPNAAGALKNQIEIEKKLNPSEKEDITKQVKVELANLTTKESFYDWIADEKNLAKATVYANDALTHLGKIYGYGENTEYDTLGLAIATAKDKGAIENLRNRVENSNLSDKDKKQLLNSLNTRENTIVSKESAEDNRKYREEQRAEKQREKEAKKISDEVEDSLYAYESQGSDNYFTEAQKSWSKLSPEAKRRVRATYKQLAKDENKEAKDLLKESQQLRYNELSDMRRAGTLTQAIIDEEEEKGNISPKQSEKLSDALWKQNEKNIEKQHKTDVEEDKKLIYVNSINGVPTEASELISSDPSVLSLLKSTNASTNEKNYKRALAQVQDDIFANPNLDDETKAAYVNSLVEKNIEGTHSPLADVENIIKQATSPEFDKIKNIKKQLAQKMITPLSGDIYKSYIARQNAEALNEAISVLNNGKEPNIDEIANKYRPTLEGWQEDMQTRESAYYSLLGLRNNMFDIVTRKDKKTGKTGSSYKVAKGYSAEEYLHYEQMVENNNRKGLYTAQQYDNLRKPIVVNKGYIYNTLAEKTDTIEGMVANTLKTEYGGQYIEDVNRFANDFWQCLRYVEEKSGKARTESPVFGIGWLVKGTIQGYVKEWIKSSKSQYYTDTLEGMK